MFRITEMTDSTAIGIQILFFASAREAVGNITSTELQVPQGCNTLQLRKLLAERYPKLAPLVLNSNQITLALNEEYVTPEQETNGQAIVLKQGDTIAIIPPISGG